MQHELLWNVRRIYPPFISSFSYWMHLVMGGGLGFGIQLSLTNYKFPGDNCFSGGLLGPDGTNWHLGKWCKKAQRKESTTLSTGLQGSNASTGNLIAVGADGRGGRIKVLRSLGQSSSVGISSHSWFLLLQKQFSRVHPWTESVKWHSGLELCLWLHLKNYLKVWFEFIVFQDIEDASSCAKKFKHVAKTNSSHSQGCLQIEHFFQRTGQWPMNIVSRMSSVLKNYGACFNLSQRSFVEILYLSNKSWNIY